MHGYVNINKAEMKVREYELYNGYYCGLCKSIGRRFNQISRLGLSYDAVFLAMVLSSLEPGTERVTQEHCIIHHIRKKPVVHDEDAVDFAADMMIILAYYNFLDDIDDGSGLKGRAGIAAVKKAFERLKKQYPQLCSLIEKNLNELKRLEEEESGSIDRTAETFGNIMGAVFSSYFDDEQVNRILKYFGYNLGCWIYLMDAIDDLDEDIAKNRYNPLKFRKGNVDQIKPVLYNYMGAITSSMDLMEFKKNKDIIENIVLLGMRGRMDQLFEEGSKD